MFVTEQVRRCLEADPIIYDPFRMFQKDDPSNRIGAFSFRDTRRDINADERADDEVQKRGGTRVKRNSEIMPSSKLGKDSVPEGDS